jgi:tripartite ATP-independent transporter DctP family solute receptor
MKRSLLHYLLASSFALTVAVLTGTVHAQAQPLRIRITNQLPPSSPMSRGLEVWKDKVEKSSQGRIRVELYPSSQLYKDNEVIPAVQKKNIEAGLVVAGQFSAFDPIFAIFDLPGLFTSYSQAIRAIDGQLGGQLAARMSRLGVHPLYWAQQGFVEVATVRKAVNSPSDLKGMKLRVHSRELARMAQLNGAAPTTIAASEVSTALSQGTVDGITTSISSYEARKWFEGAPNVTNSKFGLVAIVIIINQDVWNGLPQDLKEILAEASRAASAYSTQRVLQEESEILARLTKANVKVTQFDAKGRAEFENRTRPMYDEFYKVTGNDGRAAVKYVNGLRE